jgi:DNA-binding response OmpR family regulator
MPLPLAMIIEDDPQLNHIFSVTLKQHFEIESHTDGEAALRRLALVAPAVIVLDLNLPGAGGRQVLKQIRSDKRLEHSRVILATADDRQVEILRDAADVVLLKPVSPSLLRELAIRLKTPKTPPGPDG